jgi:hypothetical protein
MYRPTVRYSDEYKKYVDAVFHTTTLDRNQILRMALFVAAHTNEFNSIVNNYKKGDVPPPSPAWSLSDQSLWMESNPKIEGEGETSSDEFRRETSVEKFNGDFERSRNEVKRFGRDESNPRRERQIYQRKETGGITIKIG